jgi:hypothetical protein
MCLRAILSASRNPTSRHTLLPDRAPGSRQLTSQRPPSGGFAHRVTAPSPTPPAP